MALTVAVAGLGAMGSAAAFHLARRGHRVIGFDRFAPPHAHGSAHGGSRIIREAYFEDPAYVPLLARAYELWDELERLSHARLFTRTGGLFMGPADGDVVPGALRAAREHALAHEHLTARDLRARFPQFRVPDGWEAVLEPRAGSLDPEACVAAHLQGAHDAGASLRLDQPVTEWRADEDGVTVTTARGEHRVDRLVLAAGAWLPRLASDLGIPFTVERRVQFLFEPAANAHRFAPERSPVYGLELEDGEFLYGFPDLGKGVKVAFHHRGGATDPDRVDRSVHPEEEAAMREALRRVMPDLDGPLKGTLTCLYTMTPDKHFVLDVHPRHRSVVVASPCSGHGFKFSSVVGELVADLVEGNPPRQDLSLFSPQRFMS